MKHLLQLIVLFIFTVFIASCSVTHRTMREPNSRVNFNKADFTMSEQATGTATCTKVLAIDWYRLFHSNDMGFVNGIYETRSLINYASIPIIGSIVADRTSSYALCDMMARTPGYDVVFYPQFEARIKKPVLGIGFFYKKTTVKATARLAKFK